MVLAEAALAGIVLGLLLGGRIAGLARLQIRRIGLAYAAIALQVVAFPSGKLPWSTPETAARALWVGSYALLLWFVASNWSIRGVPLVTAGLLSNLVAVLGNGGLMPANPAAIRAAGLAYRLNNNSVTLDHPHLAWLTDRWPVPAWIPLGTVYSVGDVIIAAGTMLVVCLAMRSARRSLPALLLPAPPAGE
jgi:hypothetical protein